MVSFTAPSERLAAEPVYSNPALASISNQGRKHRGQEHRVTLPVPPNTVHFCFSHSKFTEKTLTYASLYFCVEQLMQDLRTCLVWIQLFGIVVFIHIPNKHFPHPRDFETMVVCLLREGGQLFIELDL